MSGFVLLLMQSQQVLLLHLHAGTLTLIEFSRPRVVGGLVGF